MSQPLIMQRFWPRNSSVDRHIVPVDVATAADFSAISWDKSSLQCSSVLKATTSIGSLNWSRTEGRRLPSRCRRARSSGRCHAARAFHDQIDRLIGAIWHTLRKLRIARSPCNGDLITMHGKSSSDVLDVLNRVPGGDDNARLPSRTTSSGTSVRDEVRVLVRFS